MKSFTITTRKTYIPIWIKKDFTKISERFIKVRAAQYENKNYIDLCFKCNKSFKLEETIALGCFKDEGNKVLCVDCAVFLLDESEN